MNFFAPDGSCHTKGDLARKTIARDARLKRRVSPMLLRFWPRVKSGIGKNDQDFHILYREAGCIERA
jgi:hypothetical protein